MIIQLYLRFVWEYTLQQGCCLKNALYYLKIYYVQVFWIQTLKFAKRNGINGEVDTKKSLKIKPVQLCVVSETGYFAYEAVRLVGDMICKFGS